MQIEQFATSEYSIALRAYLDECEASPDMKFQEFAAAVKSSRDALIAHEAKVQKLREALIAGDSEAAARIMGGSDQTRGEQ